MAGRECTLDARRAPSRGAGRRASGVSLFDVAVGRGDFILAGARWRPITARSHRQWVYLDTHDPRAERPEDEARQDETRPDATRDATAGTAPARAALGVPKSKTNALRLKRRTIVCGDGLATFSMAPPAARAQRPPG